MGISSRPLLLASAVFRNTELQEKSRNGTTSFLFPNNLMKVILKKNTKNQKTSRAENTRQLGTGYMQGSVPGTVCTLLDIPLTITVTGCHYEWRPGHSWVIKGSLRIKLSSDLIWQPEFVGRWLESSHRCLSLLREWVLGRCASFQLERLPLSLNSAYSGSPSTLMLPVPWFFSGPYLPLGFGGESVHSQGHRLWGR